jgi:hypothetical protein
MVRLLDWVLDEAVRELSVSEAALGVLRRLQDQAALSSAALNLILSLKKVGKRLSLANHLVCRAQSALCIA